MFCWFSICKQTSAHNCHEIQMQMTFSFLLSSTIVSSSPPQVAAHSSLNKLFWLIPFSPLTSIYPPLSSPLKSPFLSHPPLPPCRFPSSTIGRWWKVMSQHEKRMSGTVWPVYLFIGHPTCPFFLPSSHPLCLSPGVVSQQDNGKTFSVSSTIRIPVERKDNGAALSCEAIHPALSGQKRIRHYRLDVYCKSLLQAVCLLYIKNVLGPSWKHMK